ncbi:HEAT repeat domain-containing protein [Tunturiibacter lichenicola]|uniref:HEAT repeat domain-containing protein n=1 Tax=Tunturiibacter lichenicola TaxID=2051959 RepID=UPI003D9BFA53
MKKSFFDAKLLEDFRAAAVDYGEALETGTHKGPIMRPVLMGKKRSLRREITISLFLRMLQDENPWVKYAAAASTLDIEPQRAYQVLTELQKHPQAIGGGSVYCHSYVGECVQA